MKLYFPFVQVAGIKSSEEIKLLLEFENLYFGFPFSLDYHTEDISIDYGKDLIEKFDIHEKSILITYLNTAEEIIEKLNFLGINKVQIHSEIDLSELIKLNSNNEISIIKSLIVKKDNLSELMKNIEIQAPYVDAFITDTYDEETGAKGATGKTHDWNISKSIIENSLKPVILAGGLNPENVLKALEFCNPAGVDSHTGLEDEIGHKDYHKVKLFYDISMNYMQLR